MSFFSLMGRVGLDARGFNQGLAAIRSSTAATASNVASQLGGSLRGAVAGMIGVAGIGGLVAKYKEVVNQLANIRNQAFEFGLSTDEIQSLSYTAEQSGRKLEDLRAVMEKLTEAQRKLIQGNVEVSAAFAQLGIDAESFVRIDKPIDALLAFTDAVGKSESGLASASAKLLILGGQAQKLGAILKNDFKGTFEASKFFNIDEETIAKLSVVGDKMTDIDYTTKKFWANQGGWITDAVSSVVEGFNAGIEALKAGVSKGIESGFNGEGTIAFLESLDKSVDEYTARKNRPTQTVQGILDRLHANTGGQAIKDSVLAEMLLAQKSAAGESGGFSFFNAPGADKFTKRGFSLSGNPIVNFNPPIMRDQLNELKAVKASVDALKSEVTKKL